MLSGRKKFFFFSVNFSEVHSVLLARGEEEVFSEITHRYVVVLSGVNRGVSFGPFLHKSFITSTIEMFPILFLNEQILLNTLTVHPHVYTGPLRVLICLTESCFNVTVPCFVYRGRILPCSLDPKYLVQTVLIYFSLGLLRSSGTTKDRESIKQLDGTVRRQSLFSEITKERQRSNPDLWLFILCDRRQTHRTGLT